jgi:hypothetical protein
LTECAESTTLAPRVMPKVTFVNEHRTVEVPQGRKLSDIAAELGIAVCREPFHGLAVGNWTVWIKGADGAVSPPTFVEKLLGAKGWRRLANRAQILGDVEVWTQGGLPDRLRSPRPIAPPPSPATDPTAPRKVIDAAGTAAFPYGHPQAVGKGQRAAVPVGFGKTKKAAKPAAGVTAEPKEDEADAAEDEASE